MKQLTIAGFRERFGPRPLIGMVHLLPLPGSPSARSISEVIDAALADAVALSEGGASALMVENFGDVPFFQRVGAATVAAMTRVVGEIRRATPLPVGVNVLRNDGLAALAIAAATGARFIRVNILVGAALTDQGVIEGEAAAVLRERERICPDVAVFADHMVKHSAPIAPYDEEQLARDLRLRGLADAVLVTGPETGRAAAATDVSRLRDLLADTPLLAASGVTADSSDMLRVVDGVIAGTSLKTDGRLHNRVDRDRVRQLRDALDAVNG